MPAIEVEHLYKIFGPAKHRAEAQSLFEQGVSKDDVLERTNCTMAVCEATFNVEEEETFVIMGLSGSGKSTVLRCLNRLIEPTSGIIRVSGENVADCTRDRLLELRRTKMAMVFQHFGLLPHRTVLSNVQFGLEIQDRDAGERDKKGREALEVVGLTGYADSYPHELSGGQQQRIGLARALAADPEILLMDEAFGALDPLIRRELQDELIELQARMRKTIVFITHDLNEALKLGDRVAIMKDGVIVQIGSPEAILSEPADDYVRAFVEDVDRSRVVTAGSAAKEPLTMDMDKGGPRFALRRMREADFSAIYVTNKHDEFQGVCYLEEVIQACNEGKTDLGTILHRDMPTTSPDTPLVDLMETASTSPIPIAVVAEDGTLTGIVGRGIILSALTPSGSGHKD